MNHKHNIENVIKSMASLPLFMDKQGAKHLLLKYNAVIESGVFSNDKAFEDHLNKMEALNSVSFYNASGGVVTGKFGGNFEGVAEGSIAVVPVMGAMMRDTYCTFGNGYISGTRDLERTVEMLDVNKNVDGIVFYINTPGGQATGNESLSKKIQSCKTPTVGFFEMMASAGVGAFQGVDELYAAESESTWGSIGTYTTLINDRKYWEELGIDIIEIYAPDSTEKNKEYREAIKGNEDPMLERLEKMNSMFIKQVKKARPSIKDDGKVFKGKLYTASEAVKIGAIDGIKDLNFAIKRARFLSKNGKEKKKSNATKNQVETMSEDKKTSLWSKFFGSSTAEEAESNMEQISADLASLKEENSAIKLDCTEKQTKLDELATSNEELTNQLASLKEENSKLKEEKEAINATLEGTEFDSVEALAKDHTEVVAHNIELGGRTAAATPVDNKQSTTHNPKDNLAEAKTIKQVNQEVNERMKKFEEKKK